MTRQVFEMDVFFFSFFCSACLCRFNVIDVLHTPTVYWLLLFMLAVFAIFIAHTLLNADFLRFFSFYLIFLVAFNCDATKSLRKNWMRMKHAIKSGCLGGKVIIFTVFSCSSYVQTSSVSTVSILNEVSTLNDISILFKIVCLCEVHTVTAHILFLECSTHNFRIPD